MRQFWKGLNRNRQKLVGLIVVFAMLYLLISGPAHAQNNSFGHTSDNPTPPPGCVYKLVGTTLKLICQTTVTATGGTVTIGGTPASGTPFASPTDSGATPVVVTSTPEPTATPLDLTPYLAQELNSPACKNATLQMAPYFRDRTTTLGSYGYCYQSGDGPPPPGFTLSCKGDGQYQSAYQIRVDYHIDSNGNVVEDSVTINQDVQCTQPQTPVGNPPINSNYAGWDAYIHLNISSPLSAPFLGYAPNPAAMVGFPVRTCAEYQPHFDQGSIDPGTLGLPLSGLDIGTISEGQPEGIIPGTTGWGYWPGPLPDQNDVPRDGPLPADPNNPQGRHVNVNGVYNTQFAVGWFALYKYVQGKNWAQAADDYQLPVVWHFSDPMLPDDGNNWGDELRLSTDLQQQSPNWLRVEGNGNPNLGCGQATASHIYTRGSYNANEPLNGPPLPTLGWPGNTPAYSVQSFVRWVPFYTYRYSYDTADQRCDNPQPTSTPDPNNPGGSLPTPIPTSCTTTYTSHNVGWHPIIEVNYQDIPGHQATTTDNCGNSITQGEAAYIQIACLPITVIDGRAVLCVPDSSTKECPTAVKP